MQSYFLQFSLVVDATTDNNDALTGFKVFEGENELTLKEDGKTTVKEFAFGTTIALIKVTKDGYTEDTKENIVINNEPPVNKIEVNLPIKKVLFS